MSHSDYQTKTNDNYTVIVTEKQLLTLTNNRKKVLQLALEKEFPTKNFDQNAFSGIVVLQTESVWLCYQNFLIHYDFTHQKRLRKVDLTQWNPHQLIVENRTIWLLSKNDGQLYGLDFEPNQRTADEIEVKANHYKCIEPDPKMIEAAKAAQEKFKNKK